MIEIKGVSKKFDNYLAVNDISINIVEGIVFGLLGTNGAGKSTMLRMMSGVYKPTKGSIIIDGQDVYDNPEAKKLLFFVPDEPYYIQGGTPRDMANYYKTVYENFDMDYFYQMLDKFGLDSKRPMKTFSKGMKRQLSILLGLAAKTKYLLCDETFDGLDPVMRQAVKTLFAAELSERDFTPIIASHNLRELEDICDNVGLLHKGSIVMSQEMDMLKCNLHKLQVVLKNEADEERLYKTFDVVAGEKRGSLITLTINGNRTCIERLIADYETVYAEVLPISLEEIFISEAKGVGYDVKKLILD